MTGQIIKKISFLINIGLGSIFVFSGTTKLIYHNDFLLALKNFELIDTNLIPFVAIIIEVTEIFVGIGIAIPKYSKIFNIVAIYMLVFFTSVIIAKLYEGANISCGCFGDLSEDRISIFTVIRNLILIIFSMISIILNIKISSLSPSLNIIKEVVKGGWLLLFTFFLAIQCIILSSQNTYLRNKLLSMIADETIKKGEIISPFILLNPLRENKIINWINKYTVLFVIKPECSPCLNSLKEINRLFLENKEYPEIQYYLISLDTISNYSEFLLSNNIKVPVYFPENKLFKNNLKIHLTPISAIIDTTGKIVWLSIGIINSEKSQELKHFIINNGG